MSKRKIIIIICLLIVILFPVRVPLKDGGTIIYKSLIYKITNYHRLDDAYEHGYLEGIEIQVLGIPIYKNINKTIIDYTYTIDVFKTRNCNEQPKLYYEMNDKNIYTYCLDSITIDTGDDKVELSEYINQNNNAIEEIINNLTKVEIYKDGGTTIYRDLETSGFTKTGLTVIKCNKMLTDNSVNKDIYFGPMSMEYMDGFCTNDVTNTKTFTRTYNVLNIADSDDKEYVYLTLRQFQFDEVATVKVLEDLTLDLEENNNYEFTFQYVIKKDTQGIKELFDKYDLISIIETDKEGLAQIQEMP